MKFIFKMLVLVGMILVGKFLKQAASAEAGTNGKVPTEDSYSLNVQEDLPSTQQTKNYVVPTTKKQNTEDTFTYSFN
ncbi:hypothetical protein [Rufibacter tibetensis]|uniref:Uncharacterized protein n=1 Tax=Rufibacter tibetensis TaxID=512763 RepID=A0A0P0C7B7_9BACT|nr:hypothetical protein [Rufibacter tibetensis]ALI99274.1 hypothetical protein DC20_10155 [Rufibacter tibetensis]